MDAKRKLVATTKPQSTAAVQDAGAHSAATGLLIAALLIASSPKLTAAPAAPEISKVEPFAWTLDATNSVTLEGVNLADFWGLWTSRHGLLPADQLAANVEDDGKRLKFSIQPNQFEAPGPFAVRVVSAGGISAPAMATYGSAPEELQVNPRGYIGKTGILRSIKKHRYNRQYDRVKPGESGEISGAVDKPVGVRYRVHSPAQHQFGAVVTAGRIGSKLDPVLRILDASGKELAYANDSPGLGIDCRLYFIAPESGDYLIEIRDAQYGSGNDYRYRVFFGALPSDEGKRSTAVQSFASVLNSRVKKGITNGFRGPIAADLALTPGSEMANKRLGYISSLHDFWEHIYNFAPPPTTIVGTYPVGEPRRQGNILTNRLAFVPDGLSVNTYMPLTNSYGLQIEIKEPGRRRLTALSRRLGTESDPLMILRSPTGERLMDSHFFKNEAVISHNFKEPGVYLLDLWDASAPRGMTSACHLAIERDPADFELNTEIDSLRIPVGGEGELSVTIDRDGYDGPVKFELAQGPEGVELSDVVAKEKTKEAKFKIKLASSLIPGTTFSLKLSGRRGEAENAPKTPLYTSAYWKKRFPDLYSPMFEFEDTVWVTVLPAKD